MKRHLFLVIISLITSCSYSTKYIGTYTVKNSNTKIATDYIQMLANNNKLYKDPKYLTTDTLGFFGQPYHYFKFWIAEKDSLTYINIDYNGTSIGKRKPTYHDLIDSLDKFIQTNFVIISSHFNETDNQRKRR